MPTPFRIRLGLLVLLVLGLASCSQAEPTKREATEHTSAELAESLAGYGEVVIGFDEVRAVLVARDGELVLEEYYDSDPDASWGVQSVTKSVVSTLIGIAVDEGLIGDLDDTLAELLPQHVKAMSPQVAATTLRQLLTMTAGFPADLGATGPRFVATRSWVPQILANPEAPPGGPFVYSNGTSHLLAAILHRATGTSLLSYARQRLFDPLGIDTRPAFEEVVKDQAGLERYDRAGFAWPVDPDGTATGWYGLKLRARDLLKLGQLYLDGGSWEGRQLVPEAWVSAATSSHVDAQGLGDSYGYQWWTGDLDGEPSYQAIGYGGQLIVVVPGRELVVVTVSELRQSDPSSQGIDANVLLSIVEDAIVAEFADG